MNRFIRLYVHRGLDRGLGRSLDKGLGGMSLISVGLISLVLLSCSSIQKEQTQKDQAPKEQLIKNSGAQILLPALIRSDYSPKELTELCQKEIKIFQERIDKLVTFKFDTKQKRLDRQMGLELFNHTFGELESASAVFFEKTAPLNFMYSVSTREELRTPSQDCETQAEQQSIEVSSRKDLFQVMKLAEGLLSKIKLNPEEKRIVSETMKNFRLNGLELPDEKLNEVKKLKKELADLSTQFGANLNNNNDFAEMTIEEMQGIPESVLSRFTKLPNGNYKIPAKSTYNLAFMENASRPDARRKMLSVMDNREAQKNTEILKRAVSIRRQLAKLLGYKDWADYKTANKMAKTGKIARDFLEGLRKKLKIQYRKDYAELVNFKKQFDPKTTTLDPWDGIYLDYQLRKKKFKLDAELLREYFPTQLVLEKLFQIYSKLLRVHFIQVSNATTWHSSVQLFEVHDEKTGELLSYFYTDLYPREGKYNHAAAFPLRSGYFTQGKYVLPIAAIVANLTPPSADKPSLLSHDEVETLFHEFGHIMHMVLTKANYASLSGANVAWDFVEAPSQMLENWVWEPEILRQITGHYRNTKVPMPEELINKLVASRKFDQSYFSTRQLMLGLFDMNLHQSLKDLEPIETYKKIYKETTDMEPLPETHFPATFGHLMGGYDAGYYGYLWSQVYAHDMFTKFAGKNLLSSDVGYKYRTQVLEKGNTYPADELVKKFLGRQPNNKAFFRYLGL